MPKPLLASLKWGAVALLFVVAVLLNVWKWSSPESETSDSASLAKPDDVVGDPAGQVGSTSPIDDSVPRIADANESNRVADSVPEGGQPRSAESTIPRPASAETTKGSNPSVTVTDHGLPEDNLRGLKIASEERNAGWDTGVMLMTHDAPPTGGGFRGMLIREIARQSLLLAARDELGLPTRDRSLREPFPETPGGRPPLGVVVSTTGPTADSFDCRITIFSASDAGPVRLWEEDLVDLDTESRILSLCHEFEKLSRTRFPSVLRKAGLDGRTSRWDPDGEVDAAVVDQLRVPNFVAQYSVVRAMHGAIRSDGESPARLATLARAYANLAALVEGHWSASTKVFAARALLYSNRLVVRTDGAPESDRLRGWVLAVTGLQTRSVEAIDAAVAGGAEQTDWARLAQAFCAYDAKELDLLVEEGDLTAWAHWCRQRVTVGIVTDQMATRTSAILKECPDCYSAIDKCYAMSTGLGTWRAMSSAPFPAFVQHTYPRLRDVPHLPSPLVDLVAQSEKAERRGDFALRGRVVAELRTAADNDEREPSTAVLGHLVGDVSFLHVARQVEFHERKWGVDSNVLLDRLRPMVADHRYVAYLDVLSADATTLQGHRQRAARAVDPLEARHAFWFGFQEMSRGLESRKLWALHGTVVAHTDGVFEDLVALSTDANDAVPRPFLLRRMQVVCPRMPAVRVLEVITDWGQSRRMVPEWEKRYADDPVVLSALAQATSSIDAIEPSIRFLERKLEIAPTHSDYHVFAGICERAGETKMRLEALKAALDYPGDGLARAATRDAIAKHYMQWHEYEAALPYAEAAASSWAGGPMETASLVHACLGNWKQAEEYRRRISTRYGASAHEYFLWCLETGQGNLEESLEVYETNREPTRPDDFGARSTMGVAALVSGKLEEALEHYSAAHEASNIPQYGVLAALLADELGLDEQRDARFEKVLNLGQRVSNEERNAFQEFVRLVQKDVSEEPRGDLDLDALDRIVAEAPDGVPTKLWFLCGTYLDRHGREEQAIEYLQCAATAPATARYPRLLARAWLRGKGVEVDSERPVEKRKPVFGPAPDGSLLFDEHIAGCNGVAFSKDGSLAASSDGEGKVLVYRMPELAIIARLHDPATPGAGIAFSPDGKTLVVTNRGNVASVWNLETSTRTTRLWGHGAMAGRPEFSPDGSLLAVPYGRQDKLRTYSADITLWNTETWEEVARLSTNGGLPMTAAFTPDGQFVVTTVDRGERMGDVLWFDVESHELDESSPALPGRMKSSGHSPDGRWLSRSTSSGKFELWDVLGRKRVAEHSDAVVSFTTAVSADGRHVAYGCHDGSIRVWDVGAGRVAMAFSDNETQAAPELSFHPHGRWLAGGVRDTSVRYWDLEDPATLGRTPERELGRSVEVVVNSLDMPFVHVPAGTFEMGTKDSYRPWYYRTDLVAERPQHTVELTHPFLIGRHEVTVGQFRRFVEATGWKTHAEKRGWGRHTTTKPGYEKVPGLSWRSPGFAQSDEDPAVLIAHADAVEFCAWLSREEGKRYRLPTEAEWEYACRAGTTGPYTFDSEIHPHNRVINSADAAIVSVYSSHFRYSYASKWDDGFAFTAPVGTYLPNNWGLTEMHGNVWEWCSDSYHQRYYARSPRVDPTGPEPRPFRVQRGGSFFFSWEACRSNSRGYDTEPSSDSGFRVVLEVDSGD